LKKDGGVVYTLSRLKSQLTLILSSWTRCQCFAPVHTYASKLHCFVLLLKENSLGP